MYSRFIRTISPIYIFIFSFFIVSQLGKHFFLPFSYLSGIRIDYLAPTLYFTDILSLPLIMYSIYKIVSLRANFNFAQQSKSPHRNNIHIYFSLFFVLLLIANYIFSLSKPLWLYYFARLVQLTFLFLFFYYQGNKKMFYSSLIGGLFLGGCVELCLSLLQLSARHSLQGVWYYLGERNFSIFTPGIAKAHFMEVEFLRPYGTFSHPNSLGGFYLLIYTFILTQKRVSNVFYRIGILFVSSALVLISFSRGAIITYVIVNLFYYSRTIISCKTCSVAKIIIALVLIFFALNISGDINGIQKRTDFFEKSLSIISQRPFTGTGIGSYLIAQHNYPQKFSTFFEQPVHNIFLLVIAQLGIPLSVLFFTVFFQKIRPLIRIPYVYLPLLCVFITGFFDHYWITLQQNLLALVLLSGILISKYETTTFRD